MVTSCAHACIYVSNTWLFGDTLSNIQTKLLKEKEIGYLDGFCIGGIVVLEGSRDTGGVGLN